MTVLLQSTQSAKVLVSGIAIDVFRHAGVEEFLASYVVATANESLANQSNRH